MIIRNAAPDELPAVGELRVSSYRAGGHLSATSEYAPTLRALGADGNGHVLVALLPSGAGHALAADAGQIVGTIMLQPWPHAGEIARGPDEAEVRALAVAPSAQGRGVGAALLRHLITLAGEVGVRHLVLFTQPDMETARRLYERLGFARLQDRDWQVDPGLTLLAYGLLLTGATGSAAQPPAVTDR